MPYNLDNLLVVGISSSALFNAEAEDRIFREQGLPAFIEHQIANENTPFGRGTGYPLIAAMLRLNRLSPKRLVEVMVLSHNDPAAGLRAMNSLEHYGLDISRAAFVGRTPIGRYLRPYRVKLFLSRNEPDVREAIGQGVAAGLIYPPPGTLCADNDQLRIAFDGDAVIFSDESERVYKKTGSLEAFFEHERANAQNPMADGPFAAFLRWVAGIQADGKVRNPDGSVPIRTALVTARNGPAVKRVILTLRAWGVAIDEEHFLGGVEKAEILHAFNPHIFFDDQDVHAAPASRLVSTARVPFGPSADVPAVPAVVAVTVIETSAPEPGPAVRPDTRYSTKKAYETRLREIFSGYTPLGGSVLDPRYRKFISDTRDRSELERHLILQELARYDLGDLRSHDPMLNRDRDDFLVNKLDRVIAKAADARQGNLNLT